MRKIVIDASSFIKPFIDEEGRNEASRLIDFVINNNIKLLAPHIFQCEVFGVAKKHNVDCYQLLNLLNSYENTTLEYVAGTEQIIRKTLEITEHGNDKSGYPRFYDSIYHAIALINNCYFVTSDNRHYAKTKDLGNIRLLEDAIVDYV